jgi:hypothetical protein
MGDIQARGLQDAYSRAQQQFNTEQQLAEQSRQYGAELGIRGASAALQGAQTLGGLGQTQFGQQMDITQQQAALGGTQQQQMQAILDRQYQDFMAQQQHPYSQLDWLTAQLRGIPMGSQQQVYTPQPSMTQQLIGLGTAAAGASGLARAGGGVIPGYARGGIASLSDPQLQQHQQLPTLSALAELAVRDEQDRRAQTRQGMQPQQPPAPQRTVAEEVASGLAALDVDPMGMAGGGIVAFQAGGSPFYQQAYEQGERKGSIYDPYFGLPPEQRAQARAAAESEAGRPLDEQAARDRAFLNSIAERLGAANKDFGAAIADVATLPVRGLVGAYDTAVVRPMRAAGIQAGYLSPLLTPEGADASSMTPFADIRRSREAAQAKAEASAKDAAVMTSEAARRRAAVERSGIAAAAPAGKPSAAPVGGTGGRSGSGPQSAAGVAGAGPRVAAPRAAAPVGIAQVAPGMSEAEQIMAEMNRLAGTDGMSKELREKTEAAGRAGVSAAEEDRQALLDQQKAAGKYGEAEEKRLAAREGKIAESEDKNFYLSLIDAGAAIAGGGHPSIISALTAGVAAGSKGYQARLDKYEAQREKLDDARLRIEDARRREEMTFGSERRQATRDVRNAERDARNAEINMLSTAMGVKQKQASDVMDVVEKRRAEQKKQEFEAEQNALQRASTLEYGRLMTQGRGGAGGGSSLAAQKEQRAVLTAQINAVKAQLQSLERGMPTKANQETAARLRADIAVLGQELAKLGPDTGGASAAPAAAGKTLDFNKI